MDTIFFAELLDWRVGSEASAPVHLNFAFPRGVTTVAGNQNEFSDENPTHEPTHPQPFPGGE